MFYFKYIAILLTILCHLYLFDLITGWQTGCLASLSSRNKGDPHVL